MPDFPIASQRILDTPVGQVVGASYRWQGGQYCAIHAPRGVVGCGLFDVRCADEFGMAVAIVKGTPQKPLFEPEDILAGRVMAASKAAALLGVVPGMTGLEAVGKLVDGPSAV
jgi:uncharacterized protein YunC (DUF1805 family)